MWNLQNTVKIMYVGTCSISNVPYMYADINESADWYSGPQWPCFSMLDLFVIQKLDAYH